MKTDIIATLDGLRTAWKINGYRPSLEEVAARLDTLGYQLMREPSELRGLMGTSLRWKQGKGRPYQGEYELFFSDHGRLEYADAGRFGQMHRKAAYVFTEERATWMGLGIIGAFIALEKQLEFPLFIDGPRSGGIGQ